MSVRKIAVTTLKLAAAAAGFLLSAYAWYFFIITMHYIKFTVCQ